LVHWEGDTIISKERTAKILTYAERMSGYLIADILYDVTSGKIKNKTVKSFSHILEDKKKTSTYDRGSEFTDWELIEKETRVKAYLANAYHL